MINVSRNPVEIFFTGDSERHRFGNRIDMHLKTQHRNYGHSLTNAFSQFCVLAL